jgi:GNAT superfamily N-acetyltransferase
MVRFESISILADADRDTVFGWLRDHNLEKNGPFVEAMERGASKPLAVTARDDHGAVLGGLIGETLLDWLRVHVMAVSPASRNSEIGTRLLAHAEEEARARGCTHAYVDTMSHQSPEFYRKLGYSSKPVDRHSREPRLRFLRCSSAHIRIGGWLRSTYGDCDMRRKLTRAKLDEFMRELAAAAHGPGKVYFTGGATALLLGFREQTIDIDLKLDPEPAGVFAAIAALKDRLELNIELASPADFIPAPSDWRERSRLIAAFGGVEFFHFDFAMQALAKLERGHAQDLGDVTQFLRHGYVSPAELRELFARIQPELIRYPAIDPQQFKRKVESFLVEYGKHP